MTFIISTHQCILSPLLSAKLEKKLSKFGCFLPKMQDGLCKGTLDIKKHSAVYETSINLYLPIKTISAKSQNKSLWLAIRDAIDESIVGLNKYKQLHFSSHSKYPNHLSVRNTS